MKLIFLFLLIAITTLLGIGVAKDPGYLLIVYHQMSIEMPLWLGVLGLVLTLYLLYLAVSLCTGLFEFPQKTVHWLDQKRFQRIRRRTIRGYLALLEGHWREAEHLLIKSSHKWHTAVINYLCAATAAHQQGKIAARDEYLRLAHQVDRRADLAIGITQARLQMDSKQWEQSLATLQHLQQMAPKDDFVLVLLEQVLVQLKDWNSLLQLLPSLKKRNIISHKRHDELMQQAYLGLLNSQPVFNKMTVWDAMPDELKSDPELIKAIIPTFLANGNPETAEQLIRQGLKNHWDDLLVRFYGRIHIAEFEKQVKLAEQWYKRFPDNPTVLLTLGRFYATQGLSGQAKELLLQSLKIKPDVETYWVLGHIETNEANPDLAKQFFESGLLLSINSST